MLHHVTPSYTNALWLPLEVYQCAVNSDQVDDDQRYGPSLLESLLRGMGPAPGRAIGAATQHLCSAGTVGR